MGRLIVAGPEGSGTHLLTELLLAYGIPEATQRSLPYAGVWWVVDGPPKDPVTGLLDEPDTEYVVIQRRPDVTTLALLGRKPPLVTDIWQARKHWGLAIAALATLPEAVWVSYEALVASPLAQVERIARAVGRRRMIPGALPEVRDENAKWLSAL